MKYQIPDQVLEKLNKLFLRWGLKPEDWVLTTEPSLQRSGYEIIDEKNPFEIDLWVKLASLPWRATSGWMTLPPKNSKYLAQLEHFVKTVGYSLHMVPSPFAGYTPGKLSGAVDYLLPDGKKIKIMTPLMYIDQLVYLVTHRSTRKAFRSRIPKLLLRVKDVLRIARRKQDTKTIRACKRFLRVAEKLRPTPGHSVDIFQTPSQDGIKGQGIGAKTVNGSARLILHALDFGKMKKGEILVAPDTNPEYILILRKAKAIITDNGGISCHAAIIAREFGIPAVVGTKIATRILKDGDKILLDAKRGTVKEL
ncbi:MAG: hypothetical protein HY397_01715 [Candidatus Doudnabacteria bacterium]|nr:hypothetical protein [Candidatus Doudnabacteria bacterium]